MSETKASGFGQVAGQPKKKKKAPNKREVASSKYDEMKGKGIKLIFGVGHETTGATTYNELDIKNLLAWLDADPALCVGVLTGAGGHFSTGMDLKAYLRGECPEVPGPGLAGLTRTPPKAPLIAAVEGYALAGGFELVLACDLVIASETATFGLPEVNRGLIAGSGGLLRLAAVLPRAVAMQLALTARTVTAVEAQRWGLVNEVVPEGQALAASLELADRIADGPPLAMRCTKELIADSPGWTSEQAWRRQDELLAEVLAGDEAREGAAAFAERRPPEWGGTTT